MISATIVIPCFNAADHLERAIRSSLSQGAIVAKVIIVDDGSEDDTAVIAARLATAYPQQIEIVSQAHRGGNAARNTGARHAASSHLLFLDADDFLYPHAIERLVDGIGRADFSFGQAVYTDGEERPQTPIAQEVREDPILSFFHRAPITSSVLFTTSCIQEQPWDETLDCHQEFELLNRLVILGYSGRFVPHLVSGIRQHEGSDRITNQFEQEYPRVQFEIRQALAELISTHDGWTPERTLVLYDLLLRQSVDIYRQNSEHPEVQERCQKVYRDARRALRAHGHFPLSTDVWTLAYWSNIPIALAGERAWQRLKGGISTLRQFGEGGPS